MHCSFSLFVPVGLWVGFFLSWWIWLVDVRLVASMSCVLTSVVFCLECLGALAVPVLIDSTGMDAAARLLCTFVNGSGLARAGASCGGAVTGAAASQS